MLLLEPGTQQVLLGEQLLEVPRELRLGVDLGCPRRDPFLRQLAHHGTQLVVLGGRQVGHAVLVSGPQGYRIYVVVPIPRAARLSPIALTGLLTDRDNPAPVSAQYARAGCALSVWRPTLPLYLDTHNHVPGLTADGVAAAHARDLEVQGKHGVSYMRYWFDEATGKVYCLAEAPSADAMTDVHREAHGLLADVIVEVREGS
jgi:hypothetical protein